MTGESTVRDGVLQIRLPGARWLSSGWDGGFQQADAAYVLSVPGGWDRTDIDTYVCERTSRAEFAADGPALLTGVAMGHARGACYDPVVAYATVGLSNPAILPVEPTGKPTRVTGSPDGVGTVNVVVRTGRALSDAALAALLSVAVEAKTATLLSLSEVPGTTTDAVIVGSDRAGDDETFAGSATPVGAAARACVREAVRASFESRYSDGDSPRSVAEADYGVVTNRRAEVFRP